MFRVWYSTESLAHYVVDKTDLVALEQRGELEFRRLHESDAIKPRYFHTVPTHIKNILYLDAPDLIVEQDTRPIFSLEVSQEAGTGHNAFQRFARIAASVENGVPAFYVYPEGVYVQRQNSPGRWDRINPLIFRALEKMMRIYGIPSLLFYFPGEYSPQGQPPTTARGLLYDDDSRYTSTPESSHPEMRALLEIINIVVDNARRGGLSSDLIRKNEIEARRDWMYEQYIAKGGPSRQWSPLSATETVPTELLIRHLRRYAGPSYDFSDFLSRRSETVVYKVNANFRGDPYPGALSALDYLACREGRSYEDRHKNLAMVWGQISVHDGQLRIGGDEGKSVNRFVERVKQVYNDPNRSLLGKSYADLSGHEIPRYFMQVRFGTTFTKPKEIRVYAYFCDALLFHDGALWREG
ncbi:MAG: hypothetical protein QME75_12340 [Deltaproteobacteria bacterium]|nr:hypothetical protein [Deltaproteobacteria bacterium]